LVYKFYLSMLELHNLFNKTYLIVYRFFILNHDSKINFFIQLSPTCL